VHHFLSPLGVPLIVLDTVPAGLFKALANGGSNNGNGNNASTTKENEERTYVLSRSSHEIVKHVSRSSQQLMYPRHLIECVTGLARHGPRSVGCPPPVLGATSAGA